MISRNELSMSLPTDEILKFWKPIGSWKLIRHPSWNFYCTSLQFRACCPPTHVHQSPTIVVSVVFKHAMRGSNRQRCNWLMRPAHADTDCPALACIKAQHNIIFYLTAQPTRPLAFECLLLAFPQGSGLARTDKLRHNKKQQWQWRTHAEHSKLKSESPLTRRLGIHIYIHVPDTKLTL